MPNPAGEEIYAPAGGTIIFASDGRNDNSGVDVFQNTAVYGNVVFIRHDFGYQGQPVYTLYAHLLAALVSEGDVVQAGDPIGWWGLLGRLQARMFILKFVLVAMATKFIQLMGILIILLYGWFHMFGHGVVAGRVVDISGDYVDNVTVTIRSRLGVVASVPTYTFQNTVNDVNPDPRWGENFAVGDILVGTYMF